MVGVGVGQAAGYLQGRHLAREHGAIRLGWTLLAVVAAGVAGTVTNSAVVAALVPTSFVSLATSPGRLAVAIALAGMLPAIYAITSGLNAAALSVAALTVVASLLAKIVFGIAAPWAFVLGVNAVYAVMAWAMYLWIVRMTKRPLA